MHRIDGPGHVNNRWVAEDAANNQPPTEFTAEFFNAVQEEPASFIESMGIVLNKADNTQLGQAIRRALVAANGAQCRLQVSGANLLLAKVKTGTVFIPGYGLATVPAAGVTLAAAGLVASTLYYIYAYMNGNVIALEASTTPHATDAATGIEIKNGDSTRLLVGIEYATSATAWSGMARSWYNDTGYVGVTGASTSSTGSTSYVALATLKISFLAFAGEMAKATFVGLANTTVANYSSYTQLGYDGAAADGSLSTQIQSYTANPGNTLIYPMPKKMATDGLHYAQLYGKTDNGSSTWTGGMTIEVQPTGR